ncbi:Fc receptor-like protein 2 [Lithobates pipiens]
MPGQEQLSGAEVGCTGPKKSMHKSAGGYAAWRRERMAAGPLASRAMSPGGLSEGGEEMSGQRSEGELMGSEEEVPLSQPTAREMGRSAGGFTPVQPNLFEIPEIKVTPYPVVEGDEMTLTCDTSLSPLRPRTQLKFPFQKDGWYVQGFSSTNQYGVQSAQVKDSGNYSCEVTTTTNSVRKRSQEILVKINELFVTPVLNVSNFEVLKGDNVTLTCNTSLSPLRQRTELQFAFSRDGRNVQDFSSSDHYGIRSAQLEDSGNYSCEVRSAANISKKSEDVFVHIRGEKTTDYTLQNILRLLASGIIILIGAFIVYCHMKFVRDSKTKNGEDAEERVEEHQL